MTDKTWVATDVLANAITIHPAAPHEGVNSILIERGYVFVNNGVPLDDIGGRGYSEQVPVSSIPSNILSALQIIDNWTKNSILEQEGMT